MKHSINRRNFLKTSATASGAAMFFPNIVRSAEDRKLRIALIGTQGRATYARQALYKEDIVAICDVDERAFTTANADHRKLAAPVDMYPKAKRYIDYRELYENADDFDAVWIAIPDHHHFTAAMLAIRAGKAVYCEKPLAWSVDECQQLAAEAEKRKVPTQMGNQGMAGHGWRLAHAYYHAGAIGEVKEVHTYTGTMFDSGYRNPHGSDPIPEGLHWDLWIGPAPERPYKDKIYHPFQWRGWMDFGNGALGDWSCHLMNGFYKILEPGYPTKVECIDQSGPAVDSYPRGKTVRWDYPETKDRPGFISYWYDGQNKPPRPKALEDGRDLKSVGSYFIGTKGTLWMPGGYNDTALLLPESERRAFGKVEATVPRSIGHSQEFLAAARGKLKYNEPLSHFGYGGHLAANALLGNIAARVSGPLEYDAKKHRFKNSEEANKLLSRKPRKGWRV